MYLPLNAERAGICVTIMITAFGVHKLGEALAEALRQQYGSARRAELDELSAELGIKAALLGPVVLFTSATQVSSQNAINDSLIDFCARQVGAVYVGPFPWSWENCSEESIIGKFEPTNDAAFTSNDIVNLPSKYSLVASVDEAVQQQAAETILSCNVEYDVAMLQGFEIVVLSFTVVAATHVPP